MDDSVHPLDLGKTDRQSRLSLRIGIAVFVGASFAGPFLHNISQTFNSEGRYNPNEKENTNFAPNNYIYFAYFLHI